jgi:hypothetical protein
LDPEEARRTVFQQFVRGSGLGECEVMGCEIAEIDAIRGQQVEHRFEVPPLRPAHLPHGVIDGPILVAALVAARPV